MICIVTGVECEFATNDGCQGKGHDDCPELTATRALISQGHTRHCAYRQHFGDGECECKKGIREDW